MATSLRVEVIDDKGAKWEGDVADGIVSFVNLPSDPDKMRLEANVKLQSWPSFTLTGKTSIFIVTKLDAREIRVKRFTTTKLEVRKGQYFHSFMCYVPVVELKNFLGNIHEED